MPILKRVQSIRSDRADGPCARAATAAAGSWPMFRKLTESEWALLCERLAALPTARLAEIRAGGRRVCARSSAPGDLPIASTGKTAPARSIPSVRWRAAPTGSTSNATSGFTVAKSKRVEQRCAGRRVVWGNQDAVERALAPFGVTRSLVEWFQRWDRVETD